MAAANPLQSLREEASCSICLQYFMEPVTIDCGHNFCSDCITQCWEGLDSDFPCPQCRATSQSKLLRPNKQMGNMVEMLKQVPVKPQEANLCREHEEKLKLFCEEDQKPICLVCGMSRDHKPHTVRPIREAAQEYTERFRGYLDIMKRKLEGITGLQHQEETNVKELQEQFKSQKERIISEFEKLRQFLEEEKHRLLTSLEEEEKEILKRMEEKVTQLEEQHSSLRSLITELEEKCQQQDVELLKDVKSTISRCEHVNTQGPDFESTEEEEDMEEDIEDMEEEEEEEDDDEEEEEEEEKYLPSFSLQPPDLQMNIIESLEWRWACGFAGEVTLDPDTAHRNLILSEAGRSVRDTDTAQDLPDTPERFITYAIVLGRERLTSGRHYWEVEVGDKMAWDLGVCDESVSRKGEIEYTPEGGYWAVNLRDGEKYQANTSPYETRLTPRARPRAVGVFLDYEAGRLSLYSVEGRSLLFTFPRASFPRTLRPYFNPGLNAGGKNAGALRILPVTAED